VSICVKGLVLRFFLKLFTFGTYTLLRFYVLCFYVLSSIISERSVMAVLEIIDWSSVPHYTPRQHRYRLSTWAHAVDEPLDDSLDDAVDEPLDDPLDDAVDEALDHPLAFLVPRLPSRTLPATDHLVGTVPGHNQTPITHVPATYALQNNRLRMQIFNRVPTLAEEAEDIAWAARFRPVAPNAVRVPDHGTSLADADAPGFKKFYYAEAGNRDTGMHPYVQWEIQYPPDRLNFPQEYLKCEVAAPPGYGLHEWEGGILSFERLVICTCVRWGTGNCSCPPPGLCPVPGYYD
jgi:hypothetical protein